MATRTRMAIGLAAAAALVEPLVRHVPPRHTTQFLVHEGDQVLEGSGVPLRQSTSSLVI